MIRSLCLFAAGVVATLAAIQSPMAETVRNYMVSRHAADASAQELYDIAVGYELGSAHQKQDPELAFRYMRDASDAGLVAAHYRLWQYHDRAFGTSRPWKDRQEEKDVLYKQAMDQNFGPLRYDLAIDILKRRPGVADAEAAMMHLQAAAVDGHGLSAMRLGKIHSRGEYGMPVDHQAAVEAFTTAGHAGISEGARLAGDYYREGRHVAPDLEKSATLYYISAITSDDKHEWQAASRELGEEARTQIVRKGYGIFRQNVCLQSPEVPACQPGAG